MYLIEYIQLFRDQKTNEKIQYEEIYYHDNLNNFVPIPLRFSSTIIEEGKQTSIDDRTLWNGDFDTFCSKNSED